MQIENIQVVEYSVSQHAYHLQPLSEMLKENNQSVMADRSCDYLPIAFFKTDTEADNFIQWHRERVKKIRG